jgi:hypothetical protein
MRCLVTALLRVTSTKRQLLRLTAVSTSALQQDQSGDPTSHSEEAHRLNSASYMSKTYACK